MRMLGRSIDLSAWAGLHCTWISDSRLAINKRCADFTGPMASAQRLPFGFPCILKIGVGTVGEGYRCRRQNDVCLAIPVTFLRLTRQKVPEWGGHAGQLELT